MKNELVIKKCMKCGALVKVLKDCECEGCKIKCCSEEMKELKPNSVDAAVEKHVPTFERVGGKIVARVNHVMEDDHYIEWISLVSGNKEYTVYLKPGDEAVAIFDDVQLGTIYAYCNKHSLWRKDI